jgi:hypothetical protein
MFLHLQKSMWQICEWVNHKEITFHATLILSTENIMQIDDFLLEFWGCLIGIPVSPLPLPFERRETTEIVI